MSYGVNLNQALAGKKSIGAVATAKVQTDALNLGFPSAYQSVYAAKGIPERFFPTREHRPMMMWAGNDLQSQYHEQKRQDADYMAGAKVRATQLSRMRYVGTPHGMGTLPPPVLGQRKFANINSGAFTATSARQSHPDAPFHYAGGDDYTSTYTGGVLRSAEGQAHGIRVLRDRVGQLNDIATAKADFSSGIMPTSMGTATQSINPSAVGPAIELNLLLQQIQDSLIQGEDDSTRLDRLDLATASRALGLVFRMVPEGNSDFVEDTQAKVQNILQLLNGMLDPEQESAGFTSSARETALSLQVLFTKLNTYLTRMIAGAPVQREETQFNPLTGQQEVKKVLSQEQGANLSNPERLALSKNLVSSLGFSKMLKYAADGNDSGLLSAADRANLFNAQQGQRYDVGDMDSDNGGDDSDFDENGVPREDEAHARETGVGRSDRNFGVDERQVFGMNSGMYFPRNGRGEDEFFGEAERASTAPKMAAIAQRRGHQNRERTIAPSEGVRGRFDPDTQGFNLEVGPAALTLGDYYRQLPEAEPEEESQGMADYNRRIAEIQANTLSLPEPAPQPIVAAAPRSVASRKSTKSSSSTRSNKSVANPLYTGPEGFYQPARYNVKTYKKLPKWAVTQNAKSRATKEYDPVLVHLMSDGSLKNYRNSSAHLYPDTHLHGPSREPRSLGNFMSDGSVKFDDKNDPEAIRRRAYPPPPSVAKSSKSSKSTKSSSTASSSTAPSSSTASSSKASSSTASSGRPFKNPSALGPTAVQLRIENELRKLMTDALVNQAPTASGSFSRKEAKKYIDTGDYAEILEDTLGDGYGGYGYIFDEIADKLRARGLTTQQIVDGMKESRQDGYTMFDNFIADHDASPASSTTSSQKRGLARDLEDLFTNGPRAAAVAAVAAAPRSVASKKSSKSTKSSSTAPSSSRSTATRSIKLGVKHYNKLPTRLAEENAKAGKKKTYLGPEGQVRQLYFQQPTIADDKAVERVANARQASKQAALAAVMPIRKSQLPNTREGFEKLSKDLIAAGGPTIKVYAGSSLVNIKRNFVKRLDLAGK